MEEELEFRESNSAVIIGEEKYYDKVLYLDDESCLKIDQPGGERVYWFSDSGPEALHETVEDISYDSVRYLLDETSRHREADTVEEAAKEDPISIQVNILDPVPKPDSPGFRGTNNYVEWREWHGEKESSFNAYPLNQPFLFRKLYKNTQDFEPKESDYIVDKTLEELES